MGKNDNYFNIKMPETFRKVFKFNLEQKFI